MTRNYAILRRAAVRFMAHDGTALAGSLAFSVLLALFPFLIFATALAGHLIGRERGIAALEAIFTLLPRDVTETLAPVAEQVLQPQDSGVLTISALIALFVSSNAVETMRTAMERAYAVTKPWHWVTARFIALAGVVLGSIAAMVLGLAIVLGPLLSRLFEFLVGSPVPTVLIILRYALGTFVFATVITLMHRVLPRCSWGIKRLMPGVLFTTIVWLAAATGFSVYLSYAPSYQVTYGALSGVVVTLLFLYMSGVIVIFGAELNAAILLEDGKWRD